MDEEGGKYLHEVIESMVNRMARLFITGRRAFTGLDSEDFEGDDVNAAGERDGVVVMEWMSGEGSVSRPCPRSDALSEEVLITSDNSASNCSVSTATLWSTPRDSFI